jgi:hypothetical protein
MMGSSTERKPQQVPSDPIPEGLARFVGTLFAPDDVVLLRPIETWTEEKKRKSRVLYQATVYPSAQTLAENLKLWTRLQQLAERERANLFFGVCPRFGGKGRYDLAWQVRVVRVLWADLDGCTVEEALERCRKANLPRPTAIVRSGHGVHLY